jgi:hypothetical protein
MTSFPSPTDMILVAIMPTPRDMEIARLLGWYRIPLRTAPKVVSVDYLAFYQPASFGERKWRVETIAPVHGHELTTRAELLKDEDDHPRANEEYFKIQIGPVQVLRNPIMAGKWKRFNFLFTTGEYLMRAKTLNELTVRDQDRQVLWSALRERALAQQGYSVSELPELALDPQILVFLRGMVGESSDGEGKGS